MNDETLMQINDKLSALISILLSRNDPSVDTKPELLLASAGLKAKEIAKIVGKNEAAVQKALQRARNNR